MTREVLLLITYFLGIKLSLFFKNILSFTSFVLISFVLITFRQTSGVYNDIENSMKILL